MITWIFKLFAQLKHPPRTGRSTGCCAALQATVRPLRGTATALEKADRVSLPTDRSTIPSTVAKAKPLRIIEWVESASAHHPSSRRMVMSGRLADICAELDRLAALESA